MFAGDTLFMPDDGTARAAFPGGDADRLYESMQKLLQLPDDTRLFMCHDYKVPGRDSYAWETTVAAEKQNVHISGRSKEEFVAWRDERDFGLAAPRSCCCRRSRPIYGQESSPKRKLMVSAT